MKEEIIRCNKCVCDTTIPDIEFDEEGICNFCHLHDRLDKKFPLGDAGNLIIEENISEIKKRGKNKKYDCIVGISGGVDSTYCAYLAKKWNLRVLAVHVDNGWNSFEAEHNTKIIATKLGFDLKIVKVNCEEFKDLQVAFLEASVPEMEIPTDIFIHSTIYKIAIQENVKTIIRGHSFRQEGNTPISWTYMDGKYLEAVYKNFSGKDLEFYNNMKLKEYFHYRVIKRIKLFQPLEYLDYNKNRAKEVLKTKLDWKDYGQHHSESIYTRFIGYYVLPTKFNIDKRKISLSARIRSDDITRDYALEKLNKKYYTDTKLEKDKQIILDKLGLSEKEFQNIMSKEVRSYKNYSNYHTTLKKFRILFKLAYSIGFIPPSFYEKYVQGY